MTTGFMPSVGANVSIPERLQYRASPIETSSRAWVFEAS